MIWPGTEGAQVRGRSPVDGPGCRCPVAGFDAGDVSENDEQVGVEGLGQEAGGGVFVHDRFDTFELTQPLADDWGVPRISFIALTSRVAIPAV